MRFTNSFENLDAALNAPPGELVTCLGNSELPAAAADPYCPRENKLKLCSQKYLLLGMSLR